MRQSYGAILIIVAVVLLGLLSLVSCGRKGAPFLPEKTMTLRVAPLTAAWEKGGVVLRGQLVGPQGASQGPNHDVIGCRVYHVRYDPKEAPCEGCPIMFGDYKVIKGAVAASGAFTCEVPEIEADGGVHLFEVRLIGADGAVGAPSDRATLTGDG